MFKYIIGAFLIFPMAIMGQTTFTEGLNNMLQVESKNYLSEIEKNKNLIEDILEIKNKNCLEKKENRAECLSELKLMRVKYIKTLFETRKIYLRHIHQQRISQLDGQMETMIKELESSKRKRVRKK